MWNATRFACLVFPLLTCSGLATDDVPDISFQTVDLGGTPDARVRLKVRSRASLADQDWMRIEIENRTTQPLTIRKLDYRISLTCFDSLTGARARWGPRASGNIFDAFPSARELRPVRIQPGTHRINTPPSHEAGATLGLPSKTGWQVKGTISFQIKTEGTDVVVETKTQTSFKFHWFYPDEAGFEAMQQQLQDHLQSPVRRGHGHRLRALLRVSEVAASVTLEDLLYGLTLRVGQTLRERNLLSHERNLLLWHINEFHTDDVRVLTWFQERLDAGDAWALSDLAGATNVWQDSIALPIVELFEAQQSKRYVIHNDWRVALRLLETHGIPQQNQQIARRLSAHILAHGRLKTLDELESVPVGYKRDRAYRDLSSVIESLGMTCDRQLVDRLVPWLECKRQIVDLQVTLSIPIFFPPRPRPPPPRIRVCDVVLDSLLRIEGGKELSEHYAPWRDLRRRGDATPEKWIAEINGVHDQLIAALKVRLDRVARQ